MVSINGPIAEVKFDHFDLEAYQMFLRAKKLPESQVTYDWETDTYRLTTPARFAGILGEDLAGADRKKINISPCLWDYERFITQMALEVQRYAIFADCGLGKTLMFLEWARCVMEMTGGRVLIFSRNAELIEQTREEAVKFYGDTLPIERIETRAALIEWLKRPGSGLGITNYEKMIDGLLPELRYLAGLICDESSILKSGGGVIKWNLIKSSKGIEYKLSCTATPAPNDIMEYASQAAFLEKLRTEGEILWTFFTRDKSGEWRIKPHAREGFYRFMASWSIYGWADNVRQIPEPEFLEHKIDPTEDQMKEAMALFHDSGAGLLGDNSLGVVQRTKLSEIAKGFRYEPVPGKKSRRAVQIDSNKPAFIADLICSEVGAGRQVLVWTVFDEESALIEEALRGRGIRFGVLDGQTKPALRLEILRRFKAGELDAVVSKASLLGFGMNFQFVGAMIFSGWDDSYERFYQAVKRAFRYGQLVSLRVHIPFIPQLEGMVWENVLRKKENFEADAMEQEKYYKVALEGIAA